MIDPEEFSKLCDTWRGRFATLPPPFTPLVPGTYSIRWNKRMRSRAGIADPATNQVELNPNVLTNIRVAEIVLVHELCHLVIAQRWPYAQAHGQKWKKLMIMLGFPPKAHHNLPVPNMVHQRRWPIKCDCQTHLIATVTYNRIRKGVLYTCKSCKQVLRRPKKGEVIQPVTEPIETC